MGPVMNDNRSLAHQFRQAIVTFCPSGRRSLRYFAPAARRNAYTTKMNIVILDDYQDAVRKLHCATRLDAFSAKVYTNTVKGLGQLSVRLKDADVIVLIRERTQITRQLVEKLPRLKLIAQTGRVGSHM